MVKKVVKKVTKKAERRLERELLSVLIFLGILVLVFVVASYYFKSLNYFDYEGLTFYKKRVGDIPLFHHNYYFQAPSGKIINYNLYLRNDPRYNNVTIDGNSKLLLPGSVAYLSINSDGLAECRYSQLAVASISSFMSDNQMKVIAGNLNFWDAGSNRNLWATCENKPGNKVVEILKGNETKITIRDNCYRIEVADCRILEAVERLEVESIIQARKASEALKK